jgi:hypothetical protein
LISTVKERRVQASLETAGWDRGVRHGRTRTIGVLLDEAALNYAALLVLEALGPVRGRGRAISIGGVHGLRSLMKGTSERRQREGLRALSPLKVIDVSRTMRLVTEVTTV